MKTIPIWIGTTPTIDDTIIDEATGQPLNLTGMTVQLVVQAPDGTQTLYLATINPDQAGHTGQVSILTPGPVSVALTYWLAWWRVTNGPQIRETDTFALQILAHGQETPVNVGPCSSWITGDDVVAWCPTSNAAIADDMAAAASDLMFAMTARQFRGVCSDTIRPTRLGCNCWLGVSSGLPIAWGFWGAMLVGWGGYDWPLPIGCGYMSQYQLAYPVSQVLQVKVGGAVVDPTRYRVDEQKMLVRLNDPDGSNPGWPLCQNMLLDDTNAGTWSVMYTYGVAPPQLAVDAAKQLACQLSASGSQQACELPTGATKITRQGVQIDRGLLADWLSGGSTGLALVDAAIQAYNPSRLAIQTGVYSPDLPDFGYHVG